MTVIDHITKKDLRQHLALLDEESLRLRFGYIPSDRLLDQYADSIPDSDLLIGIYRQEQHVSVVHLSLDAEHSQAELAVSTLPLHRRQGHAEVLVTYAMNLIRNRGISTVYTVCSAANQPLLKLFNKLQIPTVATDVGEREVRLTIPAANADSVYSEMTNLQLLVIDRSLRSIANYWLGWIKKS